MTAFHDRNRVVLFLGPAGDKAEQIREDLADCGYQVLFVSRSSAAGEILAGPRKPDLFIADMGAGDREVRDVVLRVKNTPETRKIPVLALLNGDEIDVVADVFCLGCDEFLHKPFTARMLREKVEQLLFSPQRSFPRVRCRISARIITGRDVAPGEIIQISEDGAGILLEEKRREEGVLTLKFSLPEGNEEISTSAAVVHVEEVHGQFFHGVSFVDPGGQTRGLIRQYVQKAMP